MLLQSKNKEKTMNITLPLEKMTIAEKLQTMESLWDDLSRKSSEFSPPPWHGKTLKNREKNLINQTDGFSDWEEAKKRIRKTVS